jgi:hypothetical protein
MNLPAITVVEQTPGILRGLLAAATKEQMDWKPAPDRWSIAMVLAHMADAEVKGFGQRFHAMTTEQSPFLPFYDQVALFGSGEPPNGAEELEKFAERRKETVDWLRSLPDSVVGRDGRHEELGRITFTELLNELALHDLGHIRQIAEVYRAQVFYPHIGPFQRYYTMHP